MPILDLLVRECVQNSLDASLPGEGHVNIEFNVRDFDSLEMNKHLEGIQENLNKRFPKGSYKHLEIRDSNTTGLTGPLHYNHLRDNEFGNLLKLVYEISMPQLQEGAGGSWGLGKTVYFRIGIGLVFYYSRIKDEYGEYSSRLAACLVEDERESDALINFNNGKPKRGIAWWGQKADETSTMPLTDDEEIDAILRVFHTKPYSEDETGTAIIIPYINEEGLLQGIIPSHEEGHEDVIAKPWWTNSDHLIQSDKGKAIRIEDGFEASNLYLKVGLDSALPGVKHPLGQILRYLNQSSVKYSKALVPRTTVQVLSETALARELGSSNPTCNRYQFNFDDFECLGDWRQALKDQELKKKPVIQLTIEDF